jgi:hypothetical protein
MSAQTDEYSALVVKQTMKGMSLVMETQITHYGSNGVETDYTKSKNGVYFKDVIEALNTIKRSGWMVVSVTTHSNLTEDDVKAGVNMKNTSYIQYLLFKGGNTAGK